LCAKKEVQRLQQEAKELSIKPIGDLRMNSLEERGNNTIQAIKKHLNLDSDVKCTTVQFYSKSHNSQSDR
jgi:hypothetical protein